MSGLANNSFSPSDHVARFSGLLAGESLISLPESLPNGSIQACLSSSERRL
ncbi:hypothetical protein [Bacillus sp. FJAT-27445]|uniref:hypothetical protein n=1 Tax=Bacillus sp. FJAT-27445 TaxID=1679166 RepID=UPI0012E3DBA5|nr:hypothetical protein [Bacillus sp. FJAT-27445]